jgi:hypothetical protein
MAKKVKQDEVIQSQVNSLFKAGILGADENGNLIVANAMNQEQFQDF